MKIIKYGANSSDLINLVPFRYDIALNAAVMRARGDILVRCDDNETLIDNWEDMIREAWIFGTTSMKVQVVSNGKTWLETRAHLSQGYVWHRSVHPVIDTMVYEQVAVATNIVITQHSSSLINDYSDMLSASIRDRPLDYELLWRQAVHLAKDANWWDAIDMHKKHLASSKDEIFRSDSMLCLSGLLQMERFSWIMRAVAETPYRREPWYELAKYYRDNDEWAACYGASLRGLAITTPMLHETDNLAAWGADPFDIAAISAWNLNLTAQAYAFAKHAVDVDPSDIRLQSNLNAISSNR